MTIEGYLAKLPDDRREAIAQVRAVINAKLPQGYEEKFQYGMISWCVPESVLPAKEVYNKQPLAFASLGSQKNYMTLHLMSVYGDPKERVWLENAYKQAGKKLDMGAGCLRFGSIEALPLDVIGEVVSHVPVEKYVDAYRTMRATRKSANADSAKSSTKTAKSAQSSTKAAKSSTKTAKASTKAAKAAKSSTKTAKANGSTKTAKPATKNAKAKSPANNKPVAKRSN